MITIKTKADFSLILNNGKKVVSDTHILFGMHHKGEQSVPKVGFIVSKKVGNAVKRNRIKRRLKAVIQSVFDRSLSSNHDYVIIGRRKALDITFHQLNHDIECSIKKINCAYRN